MESLTLPFLIFASAFVNKKLEYCRFCIDKYGIKIKEKQIKTKIII